MPTSDDDAPMPKADTATDIPHELITIAQAAALFQRTPRTLRNWRKRGWLQAVRIGGGLYFRAADIEALLAGEPVNTQDGNSSVPKISTQNGAAADAQ